MRRSPSVYELNDYVAYLSRHTAKRKKIVFILGLVLLGAALSLTFVLSPSSTVALLLLMFSVFWFGIWVGLTYTTDHERLMRNAIGQLDAGSEESEEVSK